VLENAAAGARVYVDGDRLIQALTNLLSNAAKFSPPGGTVRVAVNRGAGTLRVAISDRGPGIPESFRDRLFQKFAQADASDSRQKGGTGLGLSITKAIVEKLGGEIDYVTQHNQGTTFFVDLIEWDESVVASNRPRVLICEPDRDVATRLSSMLNRGGFASDIVHTAARAHEMLARGTYTALTLDLALPGQDGVSLIRELRAHAPTRDLPIVVVSANGDFSHQALDDSSLWLVDWLDNPIDQGRLLAAVQRAKRSPRVGRPRILHVEDEADIRQVVATIVQDVAEVVCAASLQQAREQLRRGPFDLILLDLGLPDGHGLQLLTDLDGAAPPPVVVFSVYEFGRDSLPNVTAMLVKSNTSNQELLSTIVALMRHDGAIAPVLPMEQV